MRFRPFGTGSGLPTGWDGDWSNTYPYSDVHIYSYPYPDSDTNCYSHPDAYTNGYSYSDSHGYGNSNANTYTYAHSMRREMFAHAKAAPDFGWATHSAPSFNTAA